MSGIPSNIEKEWAAALAWMQRLYPWHRGLFIGLNVTLTVINIVTGPPWWGLWPLLITGLVFALHYLFYKASVITDDWVDERAADLYYKSYDQGHIDSISDRHGMTRINDELIERGREEKQRRKDEQSKPRDRSD